MKLRNWLTLGSVALGTVSAGIVVNTFLPRRLQSFPLQEEQHVTLPLRNRSGLPEIEVRFLRCGSIAIPEFVAVRGAWTRVPRVIAHSAVLVRHPRATFLYDTGLCTDIDLFLMDQPFLFRQTLARFDLELPLAQHLRQINMKPADLDFILLSHLHWDHVSGIPDLPGVPVKVNRLEYTAAQETLFQRFHGLIPRLMGNNPLELYDCTGPAYANFRNSYDLFGDGSIILLPLPGHTAGQVGMLINRANGSPLFLIADVGWVAENYLEPTTMHPLFWSRVTADDATAKQTLLDLHTFANDHPEIPLIPMHDARMQDMFGYVEQTNKVAVR